MPDVESKPSNNLDIKGALLKPIGSLIFNAKLLRIDYEATIQAGNEVWNPADMKSRRARAAQIYAERRMVLVEETLDRGEGTQRFLSKLAAEAGEFSEQEPAMEFDIPDYPDFSESAGAY